MILKYFPGYVHLTEALPEPAGVSVSSAPTDIEQVTAQLDDTKGNNMEVLHAAKVDHVFLSLSCTGHRVRSVPLTSQQIYMSQLTQHEKRTLQQLRQSNTTILP